MSVSCTIFWDWYIRRGANEAWPTSSRIGVGCGKSQIQVRLLLMFRKRKRKDDTQDILWPRYQPKYTTFNLPLNQWQQAIMSLCWHTLFCYQHDKAPLQPTTWKILNMKLRQKSTLNAITIPCSVKLTTVSTKIDNYFHGNHANHVIHISFTGKQTYRLC